MKREGGVEQQVRAYLDGLEASGRLACAPLIEALRTGRGTVEQACADGLLIRVPYGNMSCCMLSARDGETAKRMAAAQAGLPMPGERTEGEDMLFLADAAHVKVLAYAPPRDAIYHLCVYEGAEPVPLRGILEFRQLNESFAEAVGAQYKTLEEDEIRQRLALGWVWGGFDVRGELVGFIGEHEEASMGMLEVLPAYRRRGYGREIEAAMINRHLSEGRTPYCHVALGNNASLGLQRVLGLTVLPQLQCWCV